VKIFKHFWKLVFLYIFNIAPIRATFAWQYKPKLNTELGFRLSVNITIAFAMLTLPIYSKPLGSRPDTNPTVNRVMPKSFSARPDINCFRCRHFRFRNFYLFAIICLKLEGFDIDQLIHEFGQDFGQPAWVHVAASRRQNKREILLISSFSSPKVQRPTVEQALAYGTKEP